MTLPATSQWAYLDYVVFMIRLTLQKVRAALLANPSSAETLESLLAHDKTSNPKGGKSTEGLMWLLRGLKFTALGLRENLNNPQEELSVSFTKGYEGSLKKYHGFAVRPIFYVSDIGVSGFPAYRTL